MILSGLRPLLVWKGEGRGEGEIRTKLMRLPIHASTPKTLHVLEAPTLVSPLVHAHCQGLLFLSYVNLMHSYARRNGTSHSDIGLSLNSRELDFTGFSAALFPPLLEPWGSFVIYTFPEERNTLGFLYLPLTYYISKFSVSIRFWEIWEY